MSALSADGDGKKGGLVHLVVQRYRSCKLLQNEIEWMYQGETDTKEATTTPLDSTPTPKCHCGLLLYVSFAAEANESAAIDAAETCLNLPVLTSGLWGDGVSDQLSVRQLLQKLRHSMESSSVSGTSTSITIVPQANLICKVCALANLPVCLPTTGSGLTLEPRLFLDCDVPFR
jgi:hypothetical protein